MANGDFLLGVPAPIRAVVFITAVLGFPIVVAGFHMLQGTGWIPSVEKEQIQVMHDVVRNNEIIVKNQGVIINMLASHTRAQSIALRILCENSALERHDQLSLNNCRNIETP